jgi:hypothetical protein
MRLFDTCRPACGESWPFPFSFHAKLETVSQSDSQLTPSPSESVHSSLQTRPPSGLRATPTHRLRAEFIYLCSHSFPLASSASGATRLGTSATAWALGKLRRSNPREPVRVVQSPCLTCSDRTNVAGRHQGRLLCLSVLGNIHYLRILPVLRPGLCKYCTFSKW